MTRKSKREIQRAVEDLDGGDDEPESFGIVYEDPRTGEWYESYSREQRVDSDADVIMVYECAVVMTREKGERQGREILGPAESETNPDADLVRVLMGDDSRQNPFNDPEE